MTNLRKYGEAPFGVAVLHGGPGAPGEMAPVARKLCADRGVLEPLQTAASVEGQIEELRTVLEKDADLPVVLVGFSWGAWLGFMLAARHPAVVKKLILIGSGPFEDKTATRIGEIRLNRLGEEDRRQAVSLMNGLDDESVGDKSAFLARLGKLFVRADAYDPLPLDTQDLECRYDIYKSVWRRAAELRSSGQLL